MHYRPTWILAVTTYLALFAALFGGYVAYRLFQVESERDRLAAEAREANRQAEVRAQASKVAAWFDKWSAEVYFDGTLERTIPRWGAIIRNASDLPILDVRVLFYAVTEHGASWTGSLRSAPVEVFRVVPPDGTVKRAIADGELPQGEVDMAQAFLVGIEFTDAADRRWRRDERGKLHPADETGPP